MRNILLPAATAFVLAIGGQAKATTVDFVASEAATVEASGSFSYDTGKTGVLGYGDLSDFTISIVYTGDTYTLAQVLTLTNYAQFAYDTSTNTLQANPNACGTAGCGFQEILGAINSGFSFGFSSCRRLEYLQTTRISTRSATALLR